MTCPLDQPCKDGVLQVNVHQPDPITFYVPCPCRVKVLEEEVDRLRRTYLEPGEQPMTCSLGQCDGKGRVGVATPAMTDSDGHVVTFNNYKLACACQLDRIKALEEKVRVFEEMYNSPDGATTGANQPKAPREERCGYVYTKSTAINSGREVGAICNFREQDHRNGVWSHPFQAAAEEK